MSLRHVRQALSTAAAVAIMVQASLGLAQPASPIDLQWEAPENCPQQADVQQQVQDLLGGSASQAPAHPLRARGIIETSGEHYRLTLSIERTSSHGSRVIESDDCNSLGKAAGVVLGLLVQKERSLGRELSDTEIFGPSEPKPIPETPAPPAAKPPRKAEPERPWHILVRAPEAQVDFFSLPRLGYGIGAGVGFAYRAWQATLVGTVFNSQTHSSNRVQPFQAEYLQRSLDLLGCHEHRFGSLGVGPCALVGMNRVVASGSGDRLEPRDRAAVWFSLGGGLAAHWHLHRHVSLVATTAGALATKQPEFLVETFLGPVEAHKVPLATLAVSLGCEWIF